MNLITTEHLTHSYTERKLFDDASFSLNEQEKVGIIGINGTGKSTLLKILAGKEEPDEGTVIMGRNLRIGYLPQNPVFPESFDALTAALPLASDISGDPMDYEADAKSMLTKLGITKLSQNITELSGGQRKRIALVRTLLTPSDILILDEPTNHLDSAMAEWLENFLKNTKSALIMITHDRCTATTAIISVISSAKPSVRRLKWQPNASVRVFCAWRLHGCSAVPEHAPQSRRHTSPATKHSATPRLRYGTTP